MTGLDKLSQRKRALLNQMGVQVWYARGVARAMPAPAEPAAEPKSLPQPQPQPQPRLQPQAPLQGRGQAQSAEAAASAAEPQPTQRIAPIRFDCIFTGSGLLLLPQLEDLYKNFVRDLAQYMDWRCGVGDARLTAKEFRWPQIATSTGTPARPLQVFLRKSGADSRWMLIDAALHASLEPWLGDELPPLLPVQINAAVTQPAAKRALWSQLVAFPVSAGQA